MQAENYRPSRDAMIAIRHAAEAFRSDAVRWQGFHQYPNCPVEIGNLIALRALLGLERALNPHFYQFDDSRRQLPEPVAWDFNVVGGLYWIRNLNEVLIRRWGVESFSTAENFARWRELVKHLPETVSISAEELEEFSHGIELMGLVSTSGGAEVASPRAEPNRPTEPAPSGACRVRYNPRGEKFWIDGKEVERPTLYQFHVVKALSEAGPDGLSLEDVKAVSGHKDVPAILDRLIAKDPEIWGSVIFKAGVKGNGYRLAFQEPEATRTTHPEATRTVQNHR